MAWYDDQRPGLGDEYVKAVCAAYEQIQVNPNLIPRLERYDGAYVLRRCLLRRFPYHVIFDCGEDEIVVIAVSHNRRRPLYWLDRLN